MNKTALLITFFKYYLNSKELDHLLSADTTEDSWYDDGCIIASEILSKFSTKDWETLSNNVLTKSLDWQKSSPIVWMITTI